MGTWIYNGGTQPLVPAGRWGQGVVMPGEGIEVDNPETYGSPWTTDPESDPKPVSPPVTPEPDNPAGSGMEGVSGADNASREPSLTVEPDGDVVNQAGDVIGHVNQPN